MRHWHRAWMGASLVLLAACSTPDKPKPPPVQQVLQAPGKDYVTVGGSIEGGTVLLQIPQELRISLPLDQEAVDNRLDWYLLKTDPAVLDSLGSTFERGRSNEDALSWAGGATTFRFRSKAPGHVDLTFELRRAHVVNAAQTRHYDVTVK